MQGYFAILTFDLPVWPWWRGHSSNLTTDIEYPCQLSNLSKLHSNSPSLDILQLWGLVLIMRLFLIVRVWWINSDMVHMLGHKTHTLSVIFTANDSSIGWIYQYVHQLMLTVIKITKYCTFYMKPNFVSGVEALNGFWMCYFTNPWLIFMK